jgi:hypothetical protein
MEKETEIPDELDWLQTRDIAIQQALDSRDLAGLRAWSKEPGGFGSSTIRRKAWSVVQRRTVKQQRLMVPVQAIPFGSLPKESG